MVLDDLVVGCVMTCDGSWCDNRATRHRVKGLQVVGTYLGRLSGLQCSWCASVVVRVQGEGTWYLSIAATCGCWWLAGMSIEYEGVRASRTRLQGMGSGRLTLTTANTRSINVLRCVPSLDPCG